MVTSPLSEASTTTASGLRPWRLVVQPHADVASGRYIQAEFAADLAQVVQRKTDPEYGAPKEFFRRTYLTEGLMDLLVTGARRFTGQGGDPVVQLQTSFGGGKTHSMLALYHLFGGQIGFSEIPGGESIVSQIGDIDDRFHSDCAIVVGYGERDLMHTNTKLNLRDCARSDLNIIQRPHIADNLAVRVEAGRAVECDGSKSACISGEDLVGTGVSGGELDYSQWLINL